MKHTLQHRLLNAAERLCDGLSPREGMVELLLEAYTALNISEIYATSIRELAKLPAKDLEQADRRLGFINKQAETVLNTLNGLSK